MPTTDGPPGRRPWPASAAPAAAEAEPADEGDRRVLFFDGLQPIVFCAAVCGIIPVTWRRPVEPGPGPRPGPQVVSCFDMRKTLRCIPLGPAFRWASGLSVSFHPLRSTLPLVVAVCAVNLWSCYYTAGRRLQQLAEVPLGPQTVGQRFVGIMSLLCCASYVVVTPILLLEARRVHRLERLVRPLTDAFGSVLHPDRRGNDTEHAGMYCFQGCFFSTPIIILIWLTAISDPKYSSWKHYPVGVCQLQQVFLLTSSVVGAPLCVADFARLLAQQLEQELRAPYMAARRVTEFRHAWLDLNTLTAQVLVMPASSLLYLLVGFFFCSFEAYESTIAVRQADDVIVLVSMCAYTMVWTLTLFHVCRAGDKGAEAVKECFLDVLQRTADQWRRGPEERRELNMFTKIVAKSAPSVSVGGFFYLNNRTFSSVMASVLTYVIVLLQFQQSEEKLALTKVGDSAAAAAPAPA